MTEGNELTKIRRRRGVVRSSITRLEKRLRELEAIPSQPATADHAQELTAKLAVLDAEYKSYHLELIDLVEDSEVLEKEQDTLDNHDDAITDMNIRLKRLCSIATSSSTDQQRMSSRKLAHLEKGILTIQGAVATLPADHDDVSLIEQYEAQLSDYKTELSAVHTRLLAIDDEDEVKDQLATHSKLEAVLFECFHNIRKLQKKCEGSKSTTTSAEGTGSGVRLPKLAVPTFDGNILHWRQFWEQFCVSVHNRPSLSNAEKLVYLQHALKDGSAKSIIAGLSQSGEHYDEAVKCLTDRFDRPRLIHQTHVKMILDAPQVRDGSGRELRRLHDVIQQHVRALKSMEQEPSPSFITSLIELKLDSTTMFEWQRHTQSQNEVPHYCEMLEFLDHRAQASEMSAPTKGHSKPDPPKRPSTHPKLVSSFAANHEPSSNLCPLCKTERHHLYSCSKFRSLPHETKLATVKVNNLCMNCLSKGHFLAECKSPHRCKKCHNPHHTLLHIDQRDQRKDQPSQPTPSDQDQEVSANATTAKRKSCSLLMTCQVLIIAPNGSPVKVRALLDGGSSASFVSERLVQSLHLSRTRQNISVSGIGEISPTITVQSVANIKISPMITNGKIIDVTALVVPRVVRDLPTCPIHHDARWTHISDLRLADPEYGVPGRVEVLLGVDIFTDILLDGRRKGPPGSPTAMETIFGWVLCGSTEFSTSHPSVATVCHASVEMKDDLIRKFWEIEELPNQVASHLSMEERIVVQHFNANHIHKPDGRFMVPLPKKSDGATLGESRSQAVRRFLSLERSLNSRNQFVEFSAVIQEYFDMQHAEAVPSEDLKKPTSKVFYLPMHAVYKQSSTTTKVRAVFDASAKSSSGVSLNDTLLVGPTIHPPLIDVLLRFRMHRVAMTADVSKMYRAIELAPDDRDLHRFVWRSDPAEPLKDFRMTRLTFGVSASSFAANMSLRQNALDLAHEFPLASKVVEDNFYVDDCLTGADSIEGAIFLHDELCDLFKRGGFLLRKWNSSESAVLQSINPDLRDSTKVLIVSGSEEYTKALGLEWNTAGDHFRLTITNLPSPAIVTKRILISNIAKIFDVFGWLSPIVIKVKVLLQRLWEAKLDWDDPVSLPIQDIWLKWKSELPLLTDVHVSRYYFAKEASIISTQLHGFSDASEDAYAGVVYIRGEDAHGNTHVALVMAKTKVSPLKRLTVPRLELCGAYLLAQLLHHIKSLYQIPVADVYAWTDSTIVLNWLNGSPKRFKTFVGNRISTIVDCIPPNCWNHVSSVDNPADCASRGLYPSELLHHELWWRGPKWLTIPQSQWPIQLPLPPNETHSEEKEICLTTTYQPMTPLIPVDRYSTFSRFQRVTAWIYRFVDNCRAQRSSAVLTPYLTIEELSCAERYWIAMSQSDSFPNELAMLRSNRDITLPNNSALKLLNPFLDPHGIIRVGGRISNAKLAYSRIHPIVLHGKHPVTRLIVHTEHLRMLHASPSLLATSLSLRFHIVSLRRVVRLITCKCVTCKRYSGKAASQQQGQLPQERIVPGPVFEKVGVDYAGPLSIKYGYVRKPVIVKAYVCLFVSLTVKAVHLELVSDLTTEAFIATLRRFISRRGLPSLVWSDHGTNFIGADRELQDLFKFLRNKSSQIAISEFCTFNKIEWRFIPERAPHFGGLWESAVKSMKAHLRRITSNVKLTFEEMSTTICQIEACLNSRPLIPSDQDVTEVLTPGHFLIGRPLTALPDPSSSTSEQPMSLLRRWQLCQNLVRHFWSRWSNEYITILNKYTKWPHKSRNVSVGDIVVLRDEVLFPTDWPLARVIDVHPGRDNLVRVVTVRTAKGTYKRPVTKVVVVLPAKD